MNNNLVIDNARSRLASARTPDEYINLINESNEMCEIAMSMNNDLKHLFTPEVILELFQSHQKNRNYAGLIKLYSLLANHSRISTHNEYDGLVRFIHNEYGVDGFIMGFYSFVALIFAAAAIDRFLGKKSQ